MSEFDRLTAGHLRDAAAALDEWIAAQRHDAAAAAAALDPDGALACRERAVGRETAEDRAAD